MFNENERKKGPKWDFRSRRPILGQPPRILVFGYITPGFFDHAHFGWIELYISCYFQ